MSYYGVYRTYKYKLKNFLLSKRCYTSLKSRFTYLVGLVLFLLGLMVYWGGILGISQMYETRSESVSILKMLTFANLRVQSNGHEHYMCMYSKFALYLLTFFVKKHTEKMPFRLQHLLFFCYISTKSIFKKSVWACKENKFPSMNLLFHLYKFQSGSSIFPI